MPFTKVPLLYHSAPLTVFSGAQCPETFFGFFTFLNKSTIYGFYIGHNNLKLRHVARIFERGGLLASEASKVRQGSGCAAPSGVKGRRPMRGVREAEPPGNF